MGDAAGAVARSEQAAGDGGVGVGVVSDPHDVDEDVVERAGVEDCSHGEGEGVQDVSGGFAVEPGLAGGGHGGG